jgi:hypothetical protein
VTWASFAFIVIGGAAAVAYGLYRQDTQLNKVVTETIGTPLIGAPWELTDKSGKVSWNDAD